MQIEKGFRMNVRFVCLAGILVCLLAVFTFFYTRQASKTVTATISNTEPRRDATGQIIDAHRGCLQLFNGVFYLYGTAFGTNQDGAAKGLSFVVYCSPDLRNWTYEGKMLKDPPEGIYARAFVVFNPRTQRYVMWYSWFQKMWDGQAGVAVSDSPTGPFVIVNQKAHLRGKRPGDGSLFVDDDGTAYYIYTDIDDGYALQIEQLTPDFLDSTGKSSNVMAKGTEAPILFRRKNTYYALCGPLCPDGPEGSEVQVFTSDSPLGPFSTKLSWNINRREATVIAGLPAAATITNGSDNALSTESTSGTNGFMVLVNRATSYPNIPAQETWVTKLPAGDDSDYIWIADRWGSAPDGVKAHDLQYWSPLQFSDDGQILPLKKMLKWNISFTAEE
jgi:Glycosyl hydrolases family 43